MGGAEMFTSNKVKYLTSQNWDVRVFFYNEGKEIKIPNLKQYKSNYIPELIYDFYAIQKKKREEIIKKICTGIKENDYVVIESHLLNLCFWGELIATYHPAKNILNLMEEKIRRLSPKEVHFLEYKMQRYEILNASIDSFKRIFNSSYKNEYATFTHNYFIKPFCSNVISNESINLDFIDNADFTIISIGRLDKPYIMPTLKNVFKFINKYPNSSFNIIIIGGSSSGNIEPLIERLFSDAKNATIYNLGYIYPIPLNLINIADVGIAMANSVDVISQLGIPTINIDINDLLPIGIYGNTTNNKFRRKGEMSKTLIELLEDVLIYKKYPKEKVQLMDEQIELERVFSSQIDFLSLSLNDYATYNVSECYPKFIYIKSQLSKFIHKNILDKLK